LIYLKISFEKKVLGRGDSDVIGAQLAIRLAAYVCNLPDADVPRVACLLNLQGLVAVAVAASAHTH